MRPPLTPDQHQWVEKTLASLSLEERVAQLLIPRVDPGGSVDFLATQIGKIPFGGLFVWGAKAEEHRERIARLQKMSKVPLVVAADLEAGAGWVVGGTAKFPDPLALGAADREELAYTMGQAAALEGRAVGIHWSFAPVVDVNVNPDNPIANHRSMGDDPERIARLSGAVIRGMQDHGLAACAKHFPGDGIDDVDQHIATSVNSLSLDGWKSVSGRAFFAAQQAGVYTMMIGHIALPAWDPSTDRRGAYGPATLNPKITTGLLRNEMRFEGLAVTDDMGMGGASGYMKRADRTVACINAGCDMLLFPVMPSDYEILLAAAKSGAISEARLAEAVRRVLTLKSRLNLHKELTGPEPTAAQRANFEAAAKTIAESSITLVRDFNKVLPLKLKPGARVLTITLTNDGSELATLDQVLAERGFKVDHMTNPHPGAVDPHLRELDAIFVNFTFRANWGIGSPRSIGPHNRVFMGGFHLEHPRVVFTSFGSPYHLRQFSALPNFVNAYSASPVSQHACVAAWLGEVPMTAPSPVGNLTRT